MVRFDGSDVNNTSNSDNIDGSTLSSLYITSRLGIEGNGILTLPTIPNVEANLITLNSSIENYDYILSQTEANSQSIDNLNIEVGNILTQPISFSGEKTFQNTVNVGMTSLLVDANALRIANSQCPFFCLYQNNTGLTVLNSSNSQNISFKINNVEQASIQSDGTLNVEGTVSCANLLVDGNPLDFTTINNEIDTLQIQVTTLNDELTTTNEALAQVVNGDFQNDLTIFVDNPKVSVFGYGGANSTATIDLSTYNKGNPTTRILATDTGDYTNSLNFLTKISGNINNTLQSRLFISNKGNIGINNVTPLYLLDVAGKINCSELLVNGEPLSDYSVGFYETLHYEDVIHYNWEIINGVTTFKIMPDDIWFCYGWHDSAKYYNTNLMLTPFLTSLLQEGGQFYPISCDTTSVSYGKFYISNDNSYFDKLLLNFTFYSTTGHLNAISVTFVIQIYYFNDALDVEATFYETDPIVLHNINLNEKGENSYLFNQVIDLSPSMYELSLTTNSTVDVRLVFTDYDSTDHSGMTLICLKDFSWKLVIKTT